jgi:hypothetical protein
MHSLKLCHRVFAFIDNCGSEKLTWQVERRQDSTASLAQKAPVTSAPASRTGTMERGSLPPAIDSGGKVGALRGGAARRRCCTFTATTSWQNDLVPDNRHHPRTKHPHREYLRLVASAPLERRAGLSRDRTMPPGTGLGSTLGIHCQQLHGMQLDLKDRPLSA